MRWEPTQNRSADRPSSTVGVTCARPLALTASTSACGVVAVAVGEADEVHRPGSDHLEALVGVQRRVGDAQFTQPPVGQRVCNSFNALKQLFDQFGDDTVVHPGHGASTTLGHERPNLAEWRARGW